MDGKADLSGPTGVFFAGIMVVVISVVNWLVAIYITPVFAEAAQAYTPDFLLYPLNWFFVPAVAVAAIYSIYKLYSTSKSDEKERQAVQKVWAIGLVTASFALFAVQLFIALAFATLWVSYQV